MKLLPEKKSEFRTAVLWILLSTLFISGSSAVGFLYYQHIKKRHFHQPKYNIVAIAQTTPDKERLKTIYLAELLSLSIDRPTNLFRFNTKEAECMLKMSPLITSARIKKVLPGTLYVEYTLRKPVAYLLDYTNTVVDRERVAFPFNPFFTPKKLPGIYLGMADQQSLIWGKTLKGLKMTLALYLIELIAKHCCAENTVLTRVDVSDALADSYGQRQVIVILDEHIKKENTDAISISLILRLGLEDYRQALANYLVLRPHMLERVAKQIAEGHESAKTMIIDLRIPELAYIQELGLMHYK